MLFVVLFCFAVATAVQGTPAGYSNPARAADRKSILQFRSSEACCEDLGCYSSGGPFFDLVNRPINSVPNCGVKSKLKMHLTTRANIESTQILDFYDTQTIERSLFNATKKTKIIIHGFMDNFRWPWWTETVKELLKDGDHNVIRVDWSAGNTFPYTQATANIRLVGAYVAKFISHIIAVYNANLDDIHVIGHSLGAHGAGYAGEALREKYNHTLARITGLDPAGPYFEFMPTVVRLDPSDAHFVDTIVTDGENLLNLGFGAAQAMGHINFYPNGGVNQPGCTSGLLATIWHGPTMNSTSFDLLGTVAATAFEAVACNHARAPVLFHESINNPACTMQSFQCDSYESFLQGLCFTCKGNKCAALGYHVDQSLANKFVAKKFYTMTKEKSPFCTLPHKITFTLQNKTKENDAKQQHGQLYVTLYGTLGTSRKVLLTPESIDLNPGQTYTFFFETVTKLGVVKSMVFYWDADVSWFNPIDWIRTHYIHLHGNLLLTEVNELVSVFEPQRTKVEEKKDLLAGVINSYMQKR